MAARTEQWFDKAKGALYGLLIADALAMPTHWFYGGERQVRNTYGKIQGFVAPVTQLPGSIMSKSNTGGGGRGGFHGDVIGNIIFQGKKQFWKPGADYHYHQGMKAGDNTLEGLLMRRILVVSAENEGQFVPDLILKDYISFMTTPDTHNETYCGTCHRMFFASFAAGADPSDCPDNDGHNVDATDSLVCTVPIALLAKEEEVAENVCKLVALTRDSPPSCQYSILFASLLRSIVSGSSVKESVALAGTKIGYNVKEDVKRSRSDPVTACYITSSFPSVLFMAYKYSVASGDEKSASVAFEEGVLANANRGGENVGTGALIGALLGADCGFSNIPKKFVAGLAPGQQEVLEKEVDDFLASMRPITSTL